MSKLIEYQQLYKMLCKSTNTKKINNVSRINPLKLVSKINDMLIKNNCLPLTIEEINLVGI